MLIIVIGKIVQHDKIKLEYELINERINTNHKRYEGINEIHNKLRYVYHDLKNLYRDFILIKHKIFYYIPLFQFIVLP